jgi:hypothetical protein
MAIKQEVALTNIAQLRLQSYAFLSTKEERRIARTWRIGAVAFYGPILDLLIAFAATSQGPQAYQANLASDDFVTFYVSNSPRPEANTVAHANASKRGGRFQ